MDENFHRPRGVANERTGSLSGASSNCRKRGKRPNSAEGPKGEDWALLEGKRRRREGGGETET